MHGLRGDLADMLMPNGQTRQRNPRSIIPLVLWGLVAGLAGLTTALVVALTSGQGTGSAGLPQGVPQAPAAPAAAPAAAAAAPAAPAAAPAAPAAAVSAAPGSAHGPGGPAGEAVSPAQGSGAAAGEGTAAPPGWPDPLVLARTFTQLAARGSETLATTLAPGSPPPPQWLVDLQVTPEAGGAVLPGTGPTTQVLLPVTYRRPGRWTRGYLRVALAPAAGGYLVSGVEGPIAPRKEWARFDLPLSDAEREELPGLTGAAVIWTPRRPEPGLVAIMEALRQQLAGKVPVLMAVDLGTPPGWDRMAREQGWQGPLIRVRGYLDRFPLPTNWPFLGARGVLIDPDGRVVASLGELDPTRYGLALEQLDETALPVVQAYGLLPPGADP